MQCTVCQQVNLQTGIPDDSINETCTAGAGTLLLEFGLLSRLLGDPVYEGFARRAVNQLWSHRSNVTGLFGNARGYLQLLLGDLHSAQRSEVELLTDNSEVL